MSQLDSKAAEDLPPDRRERKKARTRRDLVEAAVRLFDERGFEGATIEDITNAADVSPRTFFRYFTSKEEILFSEHQLSVDDLRNRLAECPDGEPLLVSVREAMLTIAGRIEEDKDFPSPAWASDVAVKQSSQIVRACCEKLASEGRGGSWIVSDVQRNLDELHAQVK